MNSLKSFILTMGACVGVPTIVMTLVPYGTERGRIAVAYQSVPDPANPAAPPKDPEEMKNLYDDPAAAAVREELKVELQRLKKELRDEDQFAREDPPGTVDGSVERLRGK